MVEPRDRRIPIMFSEEELADIDEWRHNNRIGTRADAVRRLCKIALFVDEQLEDLVDTASDGIALLSQQSEEMNAAFRAIMNRSTIDMSFDRDQISDVLQLAGEHANTAEDGLQGMQSTLVTMFNAIAALVDTKNIKTAQRKYLDVIDKANAAFEEAQSNRAKRDAQSEENRYLLLIYQGENSAARDAYDLMSEDEQEEYLNRRISELKEEEANDPEGFAKRYGIDERKFWEKSDWNKVVRKHEDEREGG